MPHRTRFGVLALAAALAAACASGQSRAGTAAESGDRSGGAGAPDAAAGRPRTRRDVISLQEIKATSATSALDLIRQLRPSFLNDRGPQSLTNDQAGRLVVYLNGTRYGFVETLGEIPTAGISEIRYISGVDATQRWGVGHSGGVIYVTMTR